MKKETNKPTYVSFLLDETGSMMGVMDATMSGFNEYVDTLRKDLKDKEVHFTLVKFNSEKYEVVCSDAPLESVPKLSIQNYQPSAITPLVDSACRIIKDTLSTVKDQDCNVQVILQTDGLENASREYTNRNLHDLIKDVREKGWSVIFLGADVDAYATASKWGIPQGSTVQYAKENTKETFASTARSTVSMGLTGQSVDAEFTREEKASSGDPTAKKSRNGSKR